MLHRLSELVSIYAPWKLAAFRYSNIVAHPWVIGYKFNGFHAHPWEFLDLDVNRRNAELSKG